MKMFKDIGVNMFLLVYEWHKCIRRAIERSWSCQKNLLDTGL